MGTPTSGAISMADIRNEFYGKTVYITSYGTTDSNLYNLNYYRGKYYFTSAGALAQFPSGAISLSNFYNVWGTDPNPPVMESAVMESTGGGGGDGGGS